MSCDWQNKWVQSGDVTLGALVRNMLNLPSLLKLVSNNLQRRIKHWKLFLWLLKNFTKLTSKLQNSTTTNNPTNC